MAKLYPPNINGTIPAFYKNSEGTAKIVVPFSMNKAVGINEVKSFALKVKTVSGVYKGLIESSEYSESEVTFDVSDMDFVLGQYYKVQIAYIDKSDTVGYYSTIGVIKYTTCPTVKIDNLIAGERNPHIYSYTGVYSQNGYAVIGQGQKVKKDATEKMYSSRFYVYDEENNVIADSGDILHNTSSDDLSYESHEQFQLSQDLELDKIYYICFVVTTTNNMVVSSGRYRISQRRSIDSDITAKLVAKSNYDNGYVTLRFEDESDSPMTGTFLISRASNFNEYLWEELCRFDMQSAKPSTWSLMDCTIEQGVRYKYSIQQYNINGVYSNRIVSNEVFADFEDVFLYDGERQLKVRFNPKVSTFKNDLLETKTETIGSKYPIISRNGNVNYKEFAISGLISYHMDESELFMSKEELGNPEGVNLTSENIIAERLFKSEVLDWLTNGEAKIFKSPTEGNFIVRIMNVSMSPNDTVGRMLHTFTCTAYEIAEFNFDNLERYGFINPEEKLTVQTRWLTVDLADYTYDASDEKKNWIKINKYPAYSVYFTDARPGTQIRLDTDEDNTILIGATGSYYYETAEPIENVYVKIEAPYSSGLCTYSYKTTTPYTNSVFGAIRSFEEEDVPLQQFIGNSYWDTKLKIYDFFTLMTNIRERISNAVFVRFFKRDTIVIFVDSDSFALSQADKYNYYYDMDCTNPIDITKLDDYAIYRIRLRRKDYSYSDVQNEQYYIDALEEAYAPYTNYAIDGLTGDFFQYSTNIYKAEIDGQEINLNEIEKYYTEEITEESKIIGYRGVITELSYNKQVIEYTFEDKDYVAEAKSNYLSLLEEYLKQRANGVENLETAVQDIKTLYSKYIGTLITAAAEYREEIGVI